MTTPTRPRKRRPARSQPPRAKRPSRQEIQRFEMKRTAVTFAAAMVSALTAVSLAGREGGGSAAFVTGFCLVGVFLFGLRLGLRLGKR